MPGKYSKLKGKLEPFKVDEGWQQRIDAVKGTLVGLGAPDLARRFKILKDEKKSHEAEVEVINTELEALSQLLVEEMEADLLQKIQLTTGETAYIQDEPYSAVEDRDKVVAYFLKHAKAALTVVWQTLNAMNKERLIQGQAPLPGTKVFMKSSARLRGGSKSEESEAA